LAHSVEIGAAATLRASMGVAQIQSTRDRNRYMVRVTGRLGAGDMGRLEQACAPALIAAVPALDIDLRATRSTDRTATAVLKRLAARGARITWPVREDNNARKADETAAR
jgi:hypothetical protein